MIRRGVILLVLAAACGATSAPPAAAPAPGPAVSPTAAPPPTVRSTSSEVLAKGVNFDHIFEPWWDSGTPYTQEDRRRIASALREEEFAQVSRLGFTHVRLALGQTFLQENRPPFALRSDVLALVDGALDMARRHRLAVVLDMHQTPVPDLAGDPVQMRAFRTLWRALAARYAARDQTILYEILNEPRIEDPAIWRGIVRTLVADIREGDPDRTIVVTGGGWGGARDLVALGNLHLPNLVYTFHFYEPAVFTHQGDPWSDTVISRLRGIRYPLDTAQIRREASRARREGFDEWPFEPWAEGCGREELRRLLQPAFDLGEREGLTIWCGEFGVIRPNTPIADRTRWIADVRELLEEHGGGWCFFEYRYPAGEPGYPGMALVEEDGRPAQAVVEALDLGMPE